VTEERQVDERNPPSCTCERGTYRCHHMAVAMLNAYRSVSSTDKMCVWSRPTAAAGSSSTTSITEMYADTCPGASLDRPVSDVDRQAFLSDLHSSGRHCGMSWLLVPEPTSPAANPSTVYEKLKKSSLLVNSKSEDMLQFSKTLTVSTDDIHQIEEITRGQSTNPLWHQYRSGRLTASNMGAVIKCMESHREPSQSLIKTLLGEYDATNARPVQWGQVHEQTAIAKYESVHGQKVIPSGLWLHSSGLCGASPDGIVDDCKLVEVKCPYASRQGDLYSEHIGDKFFLTFDINEDIAFNLKNAQGHSYHHQVQANLWLSRRSQCDFVVWNPDSTVIVTVERDEMYEQKYFSMLEKFYVQHFLPHYITSFKKE